MDVKDDKPSAKHNNIFPANMYLEGFDQHNRWFLSSLILSMQLTDSAPFKTLKTHGLLVDQQGTKISKSAEESFDPEDFLEGSTKQDGSRRFGYGVDVMRAWIATKDTDKNMTVQREHIDKCNKDVKLFRDVLRVLMLHTRNYDSSLQSFELSTVDKMFMIRLLEFSKQVTEAYD